jgi:hypothetical protein
MRLELCTPPEEPPDSRNADSGLRRELNVVVFFLKNTPAALKLTEKSIL